jgi:hypothetical protein
MDTRSELLAEIAAFQSKVKVGESKIGMIALNDPKFVARLRGGRRCWPETAKKVRDFMSAAYTHITTADGTVIIRDLETGVTASGASLAEAYAELRRLLEAAVAA